MTTTDIKSREGKLHQALREAGFTTDTLERSRLGIVMWGEGVPAALYENDDVKVTLAGAA
eukprot:CAMPEP_0206330056 /NCGR_PEP_ID=MMETSP0106_2-20121207/23523_1 /ASSEMBLY_ACC=CAM_ASM_000206 /TAXON_ID=81532 /ORGANISM="Acanthoeca-like sp., Strain 10tr" /LENGTH=59 /DNA_ID=CAMNT_0053762805 /DNA_START=18 /DNA_END=194 /DNA_ORIENTATION=-